MNNFTQFLTWPGATVVPFESMLDGRRRAWSIRIRDPYQGAGYSIVAKNVDELHDSQYRISFEGNHRIVAANE